ncbi:hypothetical protein PGT21_002444 [Puccinia graminis f. sp. tritici]|uniref:Uncharacterized protein n=1 Tax=Puccinia graminis f. sp. tritici TaxID=56615 RepID=A0A5B0RQ41_PUCGR|nr:hypothetical protein PGT21_002444 [Puccinia graminis f. sp. tritici]KAA1128041.1 hypothetical protein PGTUg99_015380 [Puccinia graminis f. sp. tritici]
MKITGISMVATILSGSIYFKAHGIEFKTIHRWEWDSTDEMAVTVQAELPTWGQSRDFRLRPTPHLNLPNWGVAIHRDADMSKVCITNHGRVPLQYLLQDVHLGYLKQTIDSNHQHIIAIGQFKFWIRSWRP